jgi:hypothetical protein
MTIFELGRRVRCMYLIPTTCMNTLTGRTGVPIVDAGMRQIKQMGTPTANPAGINSHACSRLDAQSTQDDHSNVLG